MLHYEYVTKEQAAPYKKKIEEILKRVQNEVRNKFTFRYTFIGSSSRNMITFDPKTNKGFDHDVNIEVNDDDELYSPEEIRTILRTAFTRASREFGFDKCEDSTRVITIKKTDPWYSRITYSCDFAVVFYGEKGQQYIRFNKQAGSYTWQTQAQPYKELEKRAEVLKENGCWNEVRELYLDKKNSNDNPDKHSRALYAETINECYQRYCSRNKQPQKKDGKENLAIRRKL